MRVRNTALRIERILAQLATNQLGLFTTRQAEELGVSQNAILERVDANLIDRCHAGVYRHRLSEKSFERRCLAACLAVDRSVLTGRSAAVVHGLPIGRRPTLPDLVVPHGFKYRSRGIAVGQTRHPFDSEPWKTARITTVGATLITIAGSVNVVTLARRVDHALVNRLITVKGMVEAVEARPSQRCTGRKALIAELEKRSDAASVGGRRTSGGLRAGSAGSASKEPHRTSS
jgi:predicted transcriptional regulator of viral defense system